MRVTRLTYIVYLEMLYRGKYYTMTFGNGTINHDVDISISKQASSGQYSADITIKNLDANIASLFSRQPDTIGKTISVSVVLGRGEFVSQVFSGNVSSAYLMDYPTTSFTIEAVGFNLYDGVIQVSCKKGINKMRDIKSAFARKCGLQLSTNSIKDIQPLQANYFYQGAYPLTELRRFFNDEFVFVEGGVLTFKDNNTATPSLNDKRIVTLSERNGIIGVIQPNGSTQTQLQTLLFPNFQLGQKIQLNCKSFENKEYNGLWFICGLSHSGSFGYTDNEATTSLTLGIVSVV